MSMGPAGMGPLSLSTGGLNGSGSTSKHSGNGNGNANGNSLNGNGNAVSAPPSTIISAPTPPLPLAIPSPLPSPNATRGLRLGVPPHRASSSPSPSPSGWTFPTNSAGNGAYPNGPNGISTGNSNGIPASSSLVNLALPSSPRRHARSLSASTSPSPPPPATSPPSAHRRLSSASVPRLASHAAQQMHGLSPVTATATAARLEPLSRQTSVSRDSASEAGNAKRELQDLEEVHPLQAQIDRLIEKCGQHDLKFRSARSSFEHRVLSEFPSLLAELTRLDDRAEAATASIYAAVKKNKPRLQAKLDELIEQGEADVDTIRERTTPWRDILDVPSPDDTPDSASASTKTGYTLGASLHRTRSGDQRRRVPRIDRQNPKVEDEDGTALSILESWADETIRHLHDQIATLKTQLHNEGYRRILMFRFILILACVGFTLIAFYGMRRSSPPQPPPVFGPALEATP